jgi:superfamily I DNA/RNA helicase
VLANAERVQTSVLRSFEALWQELPYARELVRRAEDDHQARIDLEAVVQLSRSIGEAGSSADPSVAAFVQALGSEAAEELAAGSDAGEDAVQVLTAHATAGRGFDTVVVLDVLEGDFPSLSRPEPMFDLGALDGAHGRAEMKTARKLVQEGLAHAAASDIHRPEDQKGIAAGIAWIRKQLGPEVLEQMLAENTRRLLAGEMPEAPQAA